MTLLPHSGNTSVCFFTSTDVKNWSMLQFFMSRLRFFTSSCTVSVTWKRNQNLNFEISKFIDVFFQCMDLFYFSLIYHYNSTLETGLILMQSSWNSTCYDFLRKLRMFYGSYACFTPMLHMFYSQINMCWLLMLYIYLELKLPMGLIHIPAISWDLYVIQNQQMNTITVQRFIATSFDEGKH